VGLSHANQLTEILRSTFPAEIGSGQLEVIETVTDWGPVTKFIGSLLYQEHLLKVRGRSFDIDYWMYCDDDVQYREDVVRYYAQQINLRTEHQISHSTELVDEVGTSDAGSENAFQRYDSNGYTLFAAEKRLHFSLSHESSSRHVSHIQGVDSYLIPTSAFGINVKQSQVHTADTSDIGPDILLTTTEEYSQARTSPLSNVTNIVHIVEHYHARICPEAYYQDDYMVSFLLNLAGTDMVSIRNPCAHGLVTPAQLATTPVGNDLDICRSGLNLVAPIVGVTKENYQMHLKEEVFVRESITQQCLMDTAEDAYRAMHGAV
jgi:hypothetical protein